MLVHKLAKFQMSPCHSNQGSKQLDQNKNESILCVTSSDYVWEIQWKLNFLLHQSMRRYDLVFELFLGQYDVFRSDLLHHDSKVEVNFLAHIADHPLKEFSNLKLLSRKNIEYFCVFFCYSSSNKDFWWICTLTVIQSGLRVVKAFYYI